MENILKTNGHIIKPQTGNAPYQFKMVAFHLSMESSNCLQLAEESNTMNCRGKLLQKEFILLNTNKNKGKIKLNPQK